MSSDRLLIVSDSALVLVTTTVNVTLPPGSGSEATPAVLSTLIVGATSVIVTVASSVSQAGVAGASSSSPQAVTTSVWLVPALPDTAPTKVKLQLAPAARTVPTWQSASPPRLPEMSSDRLLIVSDSALVLVT